jgi:tocopherol cyclase
VLVVLCGVCRPPGRPPWALVALAAHPGGLVRHAIVDGPELPAGGFGVRAGEVLDGSAERLVVDLGEDARAELALTPRVPWPRRAFGGLGPAQLVPGLPQYWHPVVLDAAASGSAVLGAERVRLDGARAYAEKNWGPGFAGDWWWGHAAAFDGADASVSFAGGRIALAGVPLTPSAVVVRLGTEVLRLVPPLALVRTQADAARWRLRARSPLHDVLIEGEAGSAPHVLPVPLVERHATEPRAAQHLAGTLRLRVRRRGRTLLDAVSPLAGLERGVPAERFSELLRAESPR